MHCFGSRLKSYLVAVETCIRGMEDDKQIFHRVLKGGYGTEVMGKNYLANMGKTVAVKLGLENPEVHRTHFSALQR